MADDLNYELNIETGDSDRQVKALASALNDLSDNLREVGRSINAAASGADKIERGLAKIGKQAQTTAKNVKEMASAYDAFKPTRELLKFGANPDFAATRQALGIDLEAKAQQQAIEQRNSALKLELATRRQIVEEQRKARMGDAYVPSKTGTRGQAMLAANPLGSEGFRATQQAMADQTVALAKLRQGNIDAAKAAMDHMNRLTNLRYTLYDVQRSFLVVGVGAAAFGGLIIKSAMDYETAMAQISRTSGIAGDALNDVRDQFTELARTVPTAFSNLAEIGTLGGQLNIPSERLAGFTETVAKFTATTNVAVEQSATAFGRLDALLPDVMGNYEALGSSILNVGINSVATETEIINTTNQIAAAGQQAGFTADQIIGLAASYASLGVAPEAARGTTIRFFSEINTAIAEGGEELETFAKLSGKTSSQFAQDWQANAGTAFLDLLDGMQAVQASGQNLETILRSMGITAVRDINALLKLSQNAEIVGESFGYAAQGFSDATQLGAAFEVQAATLASQLQMLMNALQGFFAELGESSVPILSDLVAGMTDFIGVLTELAKNPAIQTAGVIAGVFTALVAVTGLLGFAFTRLLSATIAVRTAFATMKYEALAASGGMSGLAANARAATGALLGTSAAARVVKGALLSTGIGAAFLAVGFAVETVVSALDRMKPAAEQAKDVYGDVSALTSALKEDTKAAENGAKVYGTVAGQLTQTRTQTAGWADELKRASGSQADLGEASDVTTSKIKNQTLAIGDNSKAVLADMIAQNKAMQELFKLTAKQGPQDPQFDNNAFISALVANDVEKARKIIDDFYLEIEARDPIGFNTDWTEIANKSTEALNQVSGALELAATTTEITNAVYRELGVTSSDAAAQQNILAEESMNVADSMQVLRDAVDGAFASTNAISQMSQDFYNLAMGVYESGTAFDAFSQTGITNLGNFQSAIVTIIAAGETMGLSAAQSVAVLFTQLQKMGIDTANLLAQVANIPGLGGGAVEKAMGNLTPQAQKLNDVLGKIGGNAKAAGRSLGGGGGGGGGGSTAGGAKKAAQEIRTLVDYARDLGSVFQRAFELRFSSQGAIDKITTAWNDIAKGTDEALQNIKEIQATMLSLSADKSINEYFLGVAEMYGDSLRAGAIRGELADIDAKLVASQKELAKEQNKTSKTLEGNSEAAIENRSTITSLVQSYQDLIESYASSGMDQATLAVKVAQLRQQFVAQATQLGYNTVEVEKYAASFDDMALAIGRVPRNITVAVNNQPALQALAEFEARAHQAGVNASNSIGSGGGRGYGVGAINFPDFFWAGDNAARRWKAGWNTQTQSWQMRDQTTGAWVKTGVNIYKTGGYTGDVSPGGIAGLVHGKEFVVNAENTAKFRPILESMNRGQMPMMTAPTQHSGIQVVELSAYDRALLAAAGNVSLSIDGRVIADSANSANFVAASRGSN